MAEKNWRTEGSRRKTLLNINNNNKNIYDERSIVQKYGIFEDFFIPIKFIVILEQSLKCLSCLDR